MDSIPLYLVKNLNPSDVLDLINEQKDLYSAIRQHNGYFTVSGSYMFEFPIREQYSFAQVQNLWNDRDSILNNKG